MAITAIAGLDNGDHVSVFGNVNVEVSTNSSTANLIFCGIYSGATLLLSEYAPIINGKAYFNLRSTLSSLLFGINNIFILDYNPAWSEGSMGNHHAQVDVKFGEVIDGTVGTLTTLSSVILHKASKELSNGFLLPDTVNYRTAFLNQDIYPSAYSDSESGVELFGLQTSIEAEVFRNFAQFKGSASRVINDWYLPSRDELEQIEINLYDNNIGDFQIGTYWTSTQLSTTQAEAWRMSNSSFSLRDKTTSLLVRPIRHFTTTNHIAVGQWGQYGWVFYRDGNKHYEALPKEYETTAAWGLETNDITGATGTAVGTGAANTAAIVAVETDKAANYCDEIESPVAHVVLTTDAGDNSIDLTIDPKCYPRSLTLYFLNQYGGWDWYNVIDYEELTKADKAQHSRYSDMYGGKEIYQHVSEKKKELKCYGRAGIAERLAYIEGLVTSPFVFDQDGNRVRVLDNNILTDADGMLEPEFTIQYLEENTINF